MHWDTPSPHPHSSSMTRTQLRCRHRRLQLKRPRAACGYTWKYCPMQLSLLLLLSSGWSPLKWPSKSIFVYSHARKIFLTPNQTNRSFLCSVWDYKYKCVLSGNHVLCGRPQAILANYGLHEDYALCFYLVVWRVIFDFVTEAQEFWVIYEKKKNHQIER